MEPSHLDLHCLQMYVRIYLMSEVTWLYPIGKRNIDLGNPHNHPDYIIQYFAYGKGYSVLWGAGNIRVQGYLLMIGWHVPRSLFFHLLLVNTCVNECLKLLSNFIHIDFGFLACCRARWKALFFMILLEISRVDVNVLKTQRSNVNR